MFSLVFMSFGRLYVMDISATTTGIRSTTWEPVPIPRQRLFPPIGLFCEAEQLAMPHFGPITFHPIGPYKEAATLHRPPGCRLLGSCDSPISEIGLLLRADRQRHPPGPPEFFEPTSRRGARIASLNTGDGLSMRAKWIV